MFKFIQCVQNENKTVTPEETIYAIKNAGFDGVFAQIYNKDWKFSQEKQIELCLKLGLEIPFAHLGYTNINDIWCEGEAGHNLIKSYCDDLDVCNKYGIKMVVMHLVSGKPKFEPNLIGLVRFQTIVDYAEKLGIKVAFENTKAFGYLEYVLEKIQNPNAGVCFDSGHYHCHFNDTFSWDMFKNRIFALHLHDNDTSKDQHLLPFDGSLNWKETIKHLKEANYDGPISLESCYRNDYLNQSVEDFYKLSYQKAQELKELFEDKNL